MAYRKISYLIRSFILLILFISIFSCKQDPEDLGLKAEFADVKIEKITEQEYRPRKIKYLFIHAIATDPARGRWTPYRLVTFFRDPKPKGNGWDRLGYNDYVDYDAVLHHITPFNEDDYLQYNELTYNASGYNSESIAIALEGGCEYRKGKLVPKDNFTAKQILVLEARIIELKQRYPWIKVLPHNAVSSKACPVLDVKKLKI